ncbi:tripartite tricarboxylate transporter substrate binding protein [Rhodoplanes sp. TEM]|uniref:Tripartite tricarboxylate transporter substrate binding protein n=1 Tax=Rhodoplanes tepidamans TaxID=200616 RepID=A0ABT5JBB4_RHOTP|nr:MULTISPECIES: tripartite tricarboxylate transporter substrate binding protein [Rhodoplanes]MDC7786976.1 tripartite tricarboxylate transporter substrate binding protein [Rhodoplanes tepidamans]MDC7985033.1 tripartite tricarboxylate transporter substrate binding protein [Rhodoplanes sp. TEM]MDQ0355326.1 tripartite-type tricarboxylate transporter receptor subunit TctC [Rhodoplanes tepidamans]
MRLHAIVVAAWAGLLAATVAAGAEEWPAKPVRVVIPFGAGSATDVVPRVVLDQFTAQTGQPFVVENRGGAGGTIGTSAVAKAEADGYTLLATSSAYTITPALYSKLSYDVLTDFVPLGVIGSVPNVLIVAPSAGLNTVQDFVAAAKAKPGEFTFASVGIGSAVHLSAERFRASAGYEAVHIPFKGGAEALTEVIAGRVTYYFCPISTALPHIKAGRLKALAVSSPTRAAALPDVPTTLEAGYPNSDYTVWIGFFAPAKTDPAIVAAFDRELGKALASPVLKEKLTQIGVEPMAVTPAQFAVQVQKEVGTYAAFAKAIGMKVN